VKYIVSNLKTFFFLWHGHAWLFSDIPFSSASCFNAIWTAPDLFHYAKVHGTAAVFQVKHSRSDFLDRINQVFLEKGSSRGINTLFDLTNSKLLSTNLFMQRAWELLKSRGGGDFALRNSRLIHISRCLAVK